MNDRESVESEEIDKNNGDTSRSENDESGQSIPIDSSTNEGDSNGNSGTDTSDDEVADSQEERLRNKLEEIKQERDELEEKFLRKTADLDNLRKRKEEEKDRLKKYGHKGVLEDLLEVLDNFNRALDSMEFESEEVKEGIDLIDRQLRELLEKHGATSMEAEGEPFDPNYHEAMMQEEQDDLDEQTVLEVFKEGYTLYDRVLRPAQVMVGVPSSNNEDNDATSEQ